MIIFRTIAPLILGLFGIREFTKEEGVIDRSLDTPAVKYGYIALLIIMFIGIYNGVKDFKIVK